MNAFTQNPEAMFRKMGTAIIYLLPVIGITGIIATIVIGQIYFLILSTYLIVPLLFASALYRKLRVEEENPKNLGENAFKLLLVAFLLCYTISLILLTVSEVRPIIYYFTMVILTVTVLMEILMFEPAKEKIAIILLQIMALMLNVNWGVTLKYFQFIGRTDVLFHTQYIVSLLQTGHVTDVFFDYQPFPLWHILNATIYLIGGDIFSEDKVIAIASGLIFLCLPVLIYLITLKLFKDQRLALIAALLSFFFPDMTYFTMSGISRSIASLLFVLLIYLLIDTRLKNKLLLIGIVTAAIILYHSITIIFVLLILLTLYLIQRTLLNEKDRFKRINLLYIGVSAMAALLYWIFFGRVLIQEIYGNIVVPAPSGVITSSIITSPITEAFNYLQYLPAVLLILIGTMTVLTYKRFGNGAKIFAIAAFLFMWVTFPGPQYLVNKLMYNFGIDRFFEYTYPLLIIVSAAGVGALFYRSNKHLKVFLIVLFALWVMLSISNDWVASDNPLVHRQFYTYYLTQDETSAFNRIAGDTNSLILADYVPTRYLDSSKYEDRSNMLETDANGTQLLRSGPDDMMIIRYDELTKRPLKVSMITKGDFRRVPHFDTYYYANSTSDVWDTLGSYDRVYDSASVGGYV
ncbi:MAG TPA: hypothetical protein VK436_04155 [Methanocella sp.]|nr:hypothetical protein [Methanocella sp.]